MMADRVSQSLEFLGPEEKQYILNEHPKAPVAETFLLLDLSAFRVPFLYKTPMLQYQIPNHTITIMKIINNQYQVNQVTFFSPLKWSGLGKHIKLYHS